MVAFGPFGILTEKRAVEQGEVSPVLPATIRSDPRDVASGRILIL